jgi:hypothetical protein
MRLYARLEDDPPIRRDLDELFLSRRLIKMIEPKIAEIEGRFSKGQGLSGEDINTLLLKFQYNHINHLDLKLNEVTADVASLKTDFAHLRGEVKAYIAGLRTDFAELKADFAGFSGEVKVDIAGLEIKMADAINKNMRWSIGLIALIVTVLKLADTFAK